MQTQQFSWRGTEAAYSIYPSAGNDAFVLVHGVGMGRAVLDGLAAELTRAGTVYAIDLPGFGDSPTPARVASIAETGDYLAAFISSLPVQGPVVVGHSMGTQVVAEAVARHPQIARRAVLIAPTVNRAERTARQQAWRMLQDLAGESPRVLVQGTIQYMKAGPRWFLGKLRWMLDHDMEATVRRLRIPTLVMRGETDRVCPRDWVQHIGALIPDAEYAEIPGKGHEAMISDPTDAAEAILRFAR